MGAPAISKPRTAPGRAPRTKPRTAPRRTTRPATRSRSRAASRPRTLAPVAAVGRTAVAVGGLADSGFVVRMARSRVWIGVLALLLGGIVAVNVWGLGMSAGSSDTAAKIDELQRMNSVLHARMATKTSNDRIAAAAGDLGLEVPAPDAVHYIGSSSNDAERAAERLAAGKIEVAPPPVRSTEGETAEAVAAADPALAATATDPAAVDPAATDPAAVVPTTPAVDPVTGQTIDPNTGLPITP